MILDTGPLVAAANPDDPDHWASLEAIRASPLLNLPVVVIAEAGYMVGRDLGAQAEAALQRSLTLPPFTVVATTNADLLRAADLVEAYADLRLGTTDALVVATAERLGDHDVMTLDRRDLAVVRAIDGRPLRLHP